MRVFEKLSNLNIFFLYVQKELGHIVVGSLLVSPGS